MKDIFNSTILQLSLKNYKGVTRLTGGSMAQWMLNCLETVWAFHVLKERKGPNFSLFICHSEMVGCKSFDLILHLILQGSYCIGHI